MFSKILPKNIELNIFWRVSVSGVPLLDPDPPPPFENHCFSLFFHSVALLWFEKTMIITWLFRLFPQSQPLNFSTGNHCYYNSHFVHDFVCVLMCDCVCGYVCLCVSMYVCLGVCVVICECVCVLVCDCMCVYLSVCVYAWLCIYVCLCFVYVFFTLQTVEIWPLSCSYLCSPCLPPCFLWMVCSGLCTCGLHEIWPHILKSPVFSITFLICSSVCGNCIVQTHSAAASHKTPNKWKTQLLSNGEFGGCWMLPWVLLLSVWNL